MGNLCSCDKFKECVDSKIDECIRNEYKEIKELLKNNDTENK